MKAPSIKWPTNDLISVWVTCKWSPKIYIEISLLILYDLKSEVNIVCCIGSVEIQFKI